MAETALVVGAGIAGLCCALALSRRGLAVTLVGDPEASSASSVAAGMLAPAAEAALDPHAPPYPLMATALELWPALAESIGAPGAFRRCGTIIVAGDPPPYDLAADARIAVGVTLQALHEAVQRANLSVVSAPATAVWRDSVETARGERLNADTVVLAAGWASPQLAPAWPAGLELTPIRGQLIQFPPGAGHDGPMIRDRGGYLCPSPEGLLSGATMEIGVSEAEIDDAVAARQGAVALRHFPGLTGVAYQVHAGVRADTPDHRPLVGPLTNGPLIATGFRRNGWLLAPLAAEMITAYAAGEDPGAWADILSPSRFSR